MNIFFQKLFVKYLKTNLARRIKRDVGQYDSTKDTRTSNGKQESNEKPKKSPLLFIDK